MKKSIIVGILIFLALATTLYAVAPQEVDLSGDYVLAASLPGDLTLIKCSISKQDNRWVLQAKSISANSYTKTSQVKIPLNIDRDGK